MCGTDSMNTNRGYFSLLFIQFDVDERSICFFLRISIKCPGFVVLGGGIILIARYL